jgi:hypothetical protein
VGRRAIEADEKKDKGTAMMSGSKAQRTAGLPVVRGVRKRLLKLIMGIRTKSEDGRSKRTEKKTRGRR